MLKKSVQCVREINLFHSDITIIILHCQKLNSYNRTPYLSITSRIHIIRTYLDALIYLYQSMLT